MQGSYTQWVGLVTCYTLCAKPRTLPCNTVRTLCQALQKVLKEEIIIDQLQRALIDSGFFMDADLGLHLLD